MKVLLYGYYNKGNFGDNLFQFIFQKFFDEKNIEYIVTNPFYLNKNYKISNNKLFKSGSFSLDNEIKCLTNLDIITDKFIPPVDIIFLGGGEIINDYFMIPLFRYIKHNNLNNIPIYGASIGYNCNNHIKYINFIDKCIFRNKLNIIDNINYYYDNDIVFALSKYFTPNFTDIIPNTIGYYLINEIDETNYNILKQFTSQICKKYKIRFVIFEYNKDNIIIDKLIKDCVLDINNHEIVYKQNCLELINEIAKNEKHLCLRFHSHIICYLYKLQFISLATIK
jgi:polysaccharide pyruvyl transferase WcaK-like protein